MSDLILLLENKSVNKRLANCYVAENLELITAKCKTSVISHILPIFCNSNFTQRRLLPFPGDNVYFTSGRSPDQLSASASEYDSQLLSIAFNRKK